jgi:hypothetical protein
MSFIPSDQPLRWLVGKQDMISRKQVSVSVKFLVPYRQCSAARTSRAPMLRNAERCGYGDLQ